MGNVRVVGRLPGWPRILVLGVVIALIRWGLDYLDDALGRSFHSALGITLFTTILVLPFLLSFREQRLRRAILEGAVIGLSASISNGVLISISNGRWESPANVAMNAVAGAGVVVVIRLIALGVVRTLWRRIILQTGTLCWSCAYDLTGNVSGVCPECGTAISGQSADTYAKPPRRSADRLTNGER